MTDIEFLKYPIGKFKLPSPPTEDTLKEAIESIHSLPNLLEQAVISLDDSKLDTPYRPGGWTVRQVVHHLADSHMNAYIRFKLALTEENPTIKPYDESAWAALPDSQLSILPSLEIVKCTHFKWSFLMENMSKQDFNRTYFHPENNNSPKLSEVTHMYSWHGTHHLAHIQHLALRNNWLTQ
ncbi:YfiT family bacillithiol transferase [Algoriphagus hitonicola]|uniref:DinB superfamily protein n=1 Tax=Algoriphagus hitonicola TaxID=435880 RepID=A0A1I2SHE7_9BACT|nr:putative metal-dependent hydrolase [Algoriphagus hitonicola]SFG52204.1 DinB superfamily protein [Algoriphagus hitonicola]